MPTYIGRDDICDSQREGGQDAATNKGARILDLPGDLLAGRQIDITPEIREDRPDGCNTGVVRVPERSPGVQTETSSRGWNVH